MNVTKLGHCCLLIEQNGVRILTDPGTYSTLQDGVMDLAAVLITHEHADHLHVDSLKRVLKNNPGARVITNRAVAPLLSEAGISCECIEDAAVLDIGGVPMRACETQHAEIYAGVPRVLNTRFFLGETLFYPGDAFLDPGLPVKVLALPVAGPWMKLSEAMDYALRLRPEVVFPVHDGILKQAGMVHKIPGTVLPAAGIGFVPLLEGESHEF